MRAVNRETVTGTYAMQLRLQTLWAMMLRGEIGGFSLMVERTPHPPVFTVETISTMPGAGVDLQACRCEADRLPDARGLRCWQCGGRILQAV